MRLDHKLFEVYGKVLTSNKRNALYQISFIYVSLTDKKNKIKFKTRYFRFNKTVKGTVFL